MKKSILIICLVFSLLIIPFGCNKTEDIETIKLTPEQFLKEKAYEIISSDGKVDSYKLGSETLVGPHFAPIWGMQNINVDSYIGKTIDTFGFIVKNHPLDRMSGNSKHQTRVWVLVCEGKVVGGYSLPDYDTPHNGGVYSIDGKTLEEVTGEDFQTWREKWEGKYKGD